MPVPGGQAPYQPGQFYVPVASFDLTPVVPAIGIDADSTALAELAATLIDTIAIDAAIAGDFAAGTVSSTAVETANLGEGTALAATTAVGDAALLTEAAIAVLNTVSQNVTDIEPLVLAEIEALLADVVALETGRLDEASDPPPQAAALAPLELVGYHVPGPLGEYRITTAVEDEETVLALMASAWLAWYD